MKERLEQVLRLNKPGGPIQQDGPDKLGKTTFMLGAALYLGSLAIALLNFGAVDIISVMVVSFPVFGMLAALVLRYGIPAHVSPAVRTALAVAALSAAWTMMQRLDLTPLLPSHRAWQDLSVIFGTSGGSISVAPADDATTLLRLLLPLGLFLLGLRLCDTDSRAAACLSLLTVGGGAAAVAAIVQFQLAPERLLFIRKTAYLDSLTGFFVNRNTAASFFGLICVLSLTTCSRALHGLNAGRMFQLILQGRKLDQRERRAILAGLVYGLLLLSALTALLLTKSRAGIGSSLAALTLCLFLLIILPASPQAGREDRARNSPAYRPLLLALLASAGASLLLLAFAGRALLRAQIRGLEDDRFCVLPGIISGIFDNLPWGSGLASFQSAFPAYRDGACGITGVWDRAHNVYLEGLFSLGVMFPLLLAIGLGFLLPTIIKGILNRRRLRYACVAGLGSILLILLHSALDFSVQITGVSLFLASILAPVTSICLQVRRPSQHRRSA